MAGPKPGHFVSGHFAFGAALHPGGGRPARVLSLRRGRLLQRPGTVWPDAVLRLCSHGRRRLPLTLGLADDLSAQTPPSERDLKIYAGLHAAAANGDVAEIERLAAAGERPDIQDSNSRTPLHVAVYRKHHAAARALHPPRRQSQRASMPSATTS